MKDAFCGAIPILLATGLGAEVAPAEAVVETTSVANRAREINDMVEAS
jgi:hypothetical protein